MNWTQEYNQNLGPLQKSYAPNIVGQNRLLENIPETSMESMETSHMGDSRMQFKKVFANPFKTDFQKEGKSVENSKQIIQQQKNKVEEEASNENSFVELSQKPNNDKNEYFQINSNLVAHYPNLQTKLVNLEGEASYLTDDTKDFSYLSMKNFNPGLPQNDGSSNLERKNLKEAQFSNVQIQSVQNQFDSNSRPTRNMGMDSKMNINQPIDFMTLANSGQFTVNPQYDNNISKIPDKFYPLKEGKIELSNNANSSKKIEFKPKNDCKVIERGNDAKEIEEILEDLGPLNLSKISVLSNNFLDDDDNNENNDQNTELNKKKSVNQQKNTIQDNNNQINSKRVFEGNSNQAKSTRFGLVQAPISQSLPASIGHMQSQFDLNLQNYSQPAQYSSNINSSEFRKQEYNIQNFIPNHYAELNSQNIMGNLQQSNVIFHQYPNNQQTAKLPASGVNTPYNIPSNFQNYTLQASPHQQNFGNNKIEVLQNNMQTKNFQTNISKDYHNPFAENSQQKKLDQISASYQNQIKGPFPQNKIQSNSLTHNLNAIYSDPQNTRSSEKAVQEASAIVSKMQGLYKDWKEKNAELNQYLNELNSSAQQNQSLDDKRYAQNYSYENFSADQKFRQTVQLFPNNNNLYLSEKSPSPFEIRYSVQTPNYKNLQSEESNYREKLQAFMKEDLLKGLEQQDARKAEEIKQSFKVFSNPIFKGSAKMELRSEVLATTNDNSLTNNTNQRDSLRIANKIFDTSKTNKEKSYLSSAKEELDFVQNLSRVSSKGSKNNFEPSFDSKKGDKKQAYNKFNDQQEQYELKFKRQERHKVNTLILRRNSTYEEEASNTANVQNRMNVQSSYDNFKTSEQIKHKLFGFNVKREKLIQGVDERKISTEDMEIICMNCQEFVKVSQVDQHSITCDKVIQKNRVDTEIDGAQGNLDELNTKLSNLKEKIRVKISDLNLGERFNGSVNEILKAINKIIIENNYLENLNMAIQEIERIMGEITRGEMKNQELLILVYINRAVIIAKEKYAEIQFAFLDEPELLELNYKIKEYEKETIKQKAELEIWKYQSQMLTEIKLNDDKNLRYVKAHYKKDNEVLSQIQSDIDYSDKESSYDGTSVASSVVPFQHDPNIEKTPAENAKSETNKIKFYSMSVNAKLLLPQSHPGKDLLISDLYAECLSKKIPEEKWESFIKNQLGFNE